MNKLYDTVYLKRVKLDLLETETPQAALQVLQGYCFLA